MMVYKDNFGDQAFNTRSTRINLLESSRLSSFNIFKRNLFDPTLWIITSTVYLISQVICGSSSNVTFVLIFLSFFIPIHHHIESYKSFIIIKASSTLLSTNVKIRRAFLATHFNHNLIEISDKIDRELLIERKDSFKWINRIISFFWPYLSHLIHYELNQFFRDQIQSGSLGRSNHGMKRFFYAIIRQLKSNIIQIEKCQLGHQAPLVKNLSVSQQDSKSRTIRTSKEKSISNKDTTLVYNLNLEYNGDMRLAVIYKYLCCCASRIGLTDVFLHFNMQFKFGPIKEQIPFIDHLSFSLVELPEYGYKGIALVELAELKIVRRVINRLIKENLLFPKSLEIDLHDLLETLMNGPKARTEKETTTKHEEAAKDVSCCTKLAANVLLMSCFCSNLFLRTCQSRNRTEGIVDRKVN